MVAPLKPIANIITLANKMAKPPKMFKVELTLFFFTPNLKIEAIVNAIKLINPKGTAMIKTMA